MTYAEGWAGHENLAMARLWRHAYSSEELRDYRAGHDDATVKTVLAVGIGAIFLSIKAADVYSLYESGSLLEQTGLANERLGNLNTEYDLQLQTIDNDPNIINRLKGIELGQQPEREETVFPNAPDEIIAIAKEALRNDDNLKLAETAIPQWASRITEPKIRQGLFFAGAALVLISFVCFGTPTLKKQAPDESAEL